MKNLKKYLAVFIISFLVFNVSVNASTKTYKRTEQNLLLPDWVEEKNVVVEDVLKTPAVDATEKIYDYAEMLSESEEKKLYKKVKEYVEYTELDMVLVTIDSLENTDIWTYIYNFYDYNEFGRNGIIFLAYKNVDEIELYFGTTSFGDKSKVTRIYTNNRIDQITKYLNTTFNEGEYYKGFENYIKIALGFYNMQSGASKIDEEGNVVKAVPWIDLIVFSTALTFIAIVLLMYANKNKKVVVVNKDYLNKSTVVVNKISDELVDTSLKEVVKTRK